MSNPARPRPDNTGEVTRGQAVVGTNRGRVPVIRAVSSAPDYLETSHLIGAGTSVVPADRPVFLSSERIQATLHTTNPRQAAPRQRVGPVVSELNHAVNILGLSPQTQRHVTVTTQQPAALASGQARSSSASRGAHQTGSGSSAYFTGLRRVPIDFRLALDSSQSLVTAMAALEAQGREWRKKDHPTEESVDPELESGVDASELLPQPPPLARRWSAAETRTRAVQLSRKDRSLQDLQKFREKYLRIAFWEGTSNPDVVFRILELYPEIEYVVMAPALPANHRDYNPHVMKMVSPDCIDVMNYCVIGRNYVTRYIKGKHPKKMSAKRWAYEHNLLQKLREVPFFKNFRLLKAFNALGHHVDMSAFGRSRRRLRGHLFACDPLLADMLLLVRTMCLDMAQLSLIQVDGELTYTVSEFMEEQEHFTRDVTNKLERCNALLVHLTARTCWDDVISAGLAVEREGRKISAPKRISELRKLQRLRQSASAIVGHPRLQDDQSMGVWRADIDAANSFEFESQKDRHCQRLSRFIYLTDLMLRDTVHQIYSRSIAKTAEYLSLQLQTFPSDQNIAQIVRDYMGDVQIPDCGLILETDDNDGGGGGGGSRGGGAGGGSAGGGLTGPKKGGKGGDPGSQDGGGTGGEGAGGSGGESGRGRGGGGPPLVPRLPRSRSFTAVADGEDRSYGFVPIQLQDNDRDDTASVASSTAEAGQQQQRQHRQNPTLRPITVAALPPPLNAPFDSTGPTQPYIPPENEAVLQQADIPRARSSTLPNTAGLDNTLNTTTTITSTTAAAMPGAAASTVTPALTNAAFQPVTGVSTLTSAGALGQNQRRQEMLSSSSQLDITTDSTLGSGMTTTTSASDVFDRYNYNFDDEEDDAEGGENWMDGDEAGFYFIENALHDFLLQYEGDEFMDAASAITVVGDDRRVRAQQSMPGASDEGGDVALDIEIIEAAGEDMDDTLVEASENLSVVTQMETHSVALQTPASQATVSISPSGHAGSELEHSSDSLTITSDDTLTTTVGGSKRKEQGKMNRKAAPPELVSDIRKQIFPPKDPALTAGLVKTLKIDDTASRLAKRGPASLVTASLFGENSSGSNVPIVRLSEKEARMKSAQTRPEMQSSKGQARPPDTSSAAQEEASDAETLFNMCENASVTRPSLLSPEELFKDLKLSRIFYSLRDSVMESSVDEARGEADTDPVLEFPILDGHAWDPGDVERYMNVRGARGSSVDVFDAAPLTRADSTSSLDCNRNRNLTRGTASGRDVSTPVVYKVTAAKAITKKQCSTSPAIGHDWSTETGVISEEKSLEIENHRKRGLQKKEKCVVYFPEIHTCDGSLAKPRLKAQNFEQAVSALPLQKKSSHIVNKSIDRHGSEVSIYRNDRCSGGETRFDDKHNGRKEIVDVEVKKNKREAAHLKSRNRTNGERKTRRDSEAENRVRKFGKTETNFVDTRSLGPATNSGSPAAAASGGGGSGGSSGTNGKAGARGSPITTTGQDSGSKGGGAKRAVGNISQDGAESSVSSGPGGGGGGGGSGGWSARKKTPSLKPMFHASLSLTHNTVVMSPDVYDVTATAFNMIHDMEDHVLGLVSLSHNPVFLPFTRPTVAGQTTVDDLPRGPQLDLVLHRDVQVTNNKNQIYQCVDDMFHSAGVFIKEMQRLYNRVFQDAGLTSHQAGDVEFFCQQLTRHDAQLKIYERLPDSQKLGMFLIDLSPFKERVHQMYEAGRQRTYSVMNSDLSLKVAAFLEKLDFLQRTLESRPATTDLLFRRLTVMDNLESRLETILSVTGSEIAALYDVADRFSVPHKASERQLFESSHYQVASIRQAWHKSLEDRSGMVEEIGRLLERDVAWLQAQVNKVLRPMVERSLFLDGKSDPEKVKVALTETEEVVRSHVTKANFVREVQQYLKVPESQFQELFQVASRYVNTRNLWLLMADWDAKLYAWKHQSFESLDIQKINSYTFKYMEACDKLEKVLPKNTVVLVFGEKVDMMLRWLNFIIEFRGHVIKPRHWRQMEEALGVEFGNELPLTLASLMSVNAVEKQKTLHAILNKARAESNIQTEYDEVTRQCQELTIPTQQRQKVLVDGEEPVLVYLMLDTFEIEESLNYCLMELERIALSPHAGFLHASLDGFVQRIMEALENLVHWAEMQMKLTRLRRLIIRHPEVGTSLPDEIQKYKNAFLKYSDFIATVRASPSVLTWCSTASLHEFLQETSDEVVRIYRVLKRNIDSRATAQDPPNREFGTWVVM